MTAPCVPYAFKKFCHGTSTGATSQPWVSGDNVKCTVTKPSTNTPCPSSIPAVDAHVQSDSASGRVQSNSQHTLYGFLEPLLYIRVCLNKLSSLEIVFCNLFLRFFVCNFFIYQRIPKLFGTKLFRASRSTIVVINNFCVPLTVFKIFQFKSHRKTKSARKA